MDQPLPHDATPNSRETAVVGVACRGDRLLVIRRSLHVRAPRKLCLPGGAIERGETPRAAVRRELHEELALHVQPQRIIWANATRAGTRLIWWTVTLEPEARPVPNPREVEAVYWMSAAECLAHPDLLESSIEFMRRVAAGQLQLDPI